jgi:hypothetical protein
MNTQDPDANEIFISKQMPMEENDETVSIGFLYVRRSENGELLEMLVEPFQGERENLMGDNLFYFRKAGEGRYHYADFDSYPDVEDIEFDRDDPPDYFARSELKKILECAEATIQFVQMKKSLQLWTYESNSTLPKIKNLVWQKRPKRLGFR